MEELLINILGNSPTLVAVLIIYARFDKRCALVEHEINEVKERQKRCLWNS